MKEWKDIIGYENLYRISDEGDIESKDKGLLTHKINKGGYRYNHLYNNTKMKSFLVHRLVAIHFIENPNNKDFVNHLDGDKLNCIKTNLEWNTHEENMKHAVVSNLIKRGDESPLKGNKNAKK